MDKLTPEEKHNSFFVKNSKNIVIFILILSLFCISILFFIKYNNLQSETSSEYFSQLEESNVKISELENTISSFQQERENFET